MKHVVQFSALLGSLAGIFALAFLLSGPTFGKTPAPSEWPDNHCAEERPMTLVVRSQEQVHRLLAWSIILQIFLRAGSE